MSPKSQARVGIIAGTGFLASPYFTPVASHLLDTPYGEPSSRILECEYKTFILLRHGEPHHIPPHIINYRANLWALKSLGVQSVIAINAVGAIDTERFSDGDLVLPSQLIDYTYGREHTFYDGKSMLDTQLEHIEFTEPFSDNLRKLLLQASKQSGVYLKDGGTCGVTQGPRLETAAEITKLERDGCDLVGMTSLPEASLAKELGLDYASIAIVVNPAAGKIEGTIDIEAIHAIAQTALKKVHTLFEHIIV